VGSAVSTANPAPGVLYILVCGSPIARDVGVLVDLAQRDGWEVCVITTPDGRKFVDAAALQAQTGHAVRSYYKNPGDDDLLPPADAMIVAPATVNTVNKWAAGITDTLVLGLLIEGYGFGIPTVVVPYTNKVMAMHPALHDSIAKLRTWGVEVLYGDDVVSLGGPGQNDRFRSRFPWRRALQTLYARFETGSRVEPGARS
jgi:phosphopantothenoylcysteine decarboxylase